MTLQMQILCSYEEMLELASTTDKMLLSVQKNETQDFILNALAFGKVKI
jgi:hypothetical protein